MAIITRSQFSAVAQSKIGSENLRGIVNKTRRFSKTGSVTTVFLSHSHHDKSVVEEAKIFFENLGISIYVDWADQTMPESTNGITANRIKNQIISGNDKFVLLATNSAVASKWCNWEVGVADPHKLNSNKMALLSLADNSGIWNGTEYLQIYPRIERITTNLGINYFVCYPNGSSERLDVWLRR